MSIRPRSTDASLEVLEILKGSNEYIEVNGDRRFEEEIVRKTL